MIQQQDELPRPRVLIVDGGAKVLEYARKDRPDLILLDVMMPIGQSPVPEGLRGQG